MPFARTTPAEHLSAPSAAGQREEIKTFHFNSFYNLFLEKRKLQDHGIPPHYIDSEAFQASRNDENW